MTARVSGIAAALLRSSDALLVVRSLALCRAFATWVGAAGERAI